ncbi:D-amino acid oxidase [Rhizobium sp. Leaf384]|uniref:NAD(P)/FAD-dependent oxidoreductase n=1 Tax=unclassified Rhizobium TaxID=2613769 RepID=UPI00071296E0|nr:MULTISPECIES: FAD-binding oxidoreductase [unclassified Rhizobium]KQS78912.1 D-amino acid oxidase [Rhizobium sp. Leaf384]KQS82549.1 D-amino acid oxidase [Rhizobium sp. Leaf383]
MSDNTISSAVIIGAGIFGVSTAVQLLRRGVSVTLVNDGPVANGASGRSLSWLNSARMRSYPYHLLRMAGIDRYRTLSSRIGPVDWLRFDGALTWDADDDTNEIAAAYAHEVSLAYDARLLAPGDVATATPGVDAAAITGAAAIFNPGEGWVDLPALIDLLLMDFAALGGTLVTTGGRANVIVERGRATGVEIQTGAKHPADAVLIATGPAVPAMAAELGATILDGTPVALLLTTRPIDHPLKAVLNTPRVAVRPAPGGAFAIDADWAANEVVTLADGTYAVKDATVTRLLAEASRALDGHPALELAAYAAGRKPIPEDGDPVLGVLANLPGCHVAFSHSGATLGLIVGELTAYEMATGNRHPLLETFRPERFSA